MVIANKKGYKIVYWIFSLFLFAYPVSPLFAQKDTVKILLGKLPSAKEDTNKVNILNTLSEKLGEISKDDSSLMFALKAEDLAKNLGYKKGIAHSYRNEGSIYEDRGDYPKALELYLTALGLDQEAEYKSGISSDLGYTGNIYYEQGNYPKALEYYLKALKIDQELGDKEGIAIDMGNIGAIYRTQGNYLEALDYDIKALSIMQKLKDKEGMARILGNIGNIYTEEGNYNKALEYDSRAMTIYQETGNKSGIAINLGNLGNIYFGLHDYPKALEYNLKALELDRALGNKHGIASNLCNIGDNYIKQTNYKQAKNYLDSALSLAKTLGDNEVMRTVYGSRTGLDSVLRDYKTGWEDYGHYIAYRDSLINEAKTKKFVQATMNSEFEKKQAGLKAEQDKKDALAEQERKKQILIRDTFMAGFVLMLALAFFIFRGYRQKQKANEIISRQKEEVENQKALVEDQKKIVEEKNKDIIDSINYAQRIQKALLKEEERVSMHLPDHFILFKPKDIVSGDFYWSLEKEQYFYMAAVDCTGHGVPGGFMSMLGIAFLNEITSGIAALTPAEILNQLRDKILKELGQTGGEEESQDGMDISLMRMDLKTREIQWSGANNPLWILKPSSNGSSKQSPLTEIPPDKQPIGYYPLMNPFTNHVIKDEKDSIIYLFSDGYADQFGGPNGKKFMYKQLQQLLIGIYDRPLTEQKKTLEQKFMEWKGNKFQIDDVLIMGIRV
jgi:tetratricopeptide (TPR) repeat protein